MNLILTLNILLLKANVMMSDLNKQVILFCLYIYILKFGKKFIIGCTQVHWGISILSMHVKF